MGCLFAVFAGMFPRFADIFLWIARPNQFMAAFGGNWLWPILGIIFLPFTTLLYVFMQQGVGGLSTWDWLWLGLAVVMDVTNWVGHYRARTQYPGYSGVTTA